ncbi:helix-turn-helix domain-containing protein [Mycolicibacterium sp. 050158]|uniref:helix-turn-helix domain-containing protein n=1 Tax=Mycolicibacterium sp. 050158 TaxID=3090602 RepID=UPI00299E0D69|nr:helix-turn-helix domain-containing protein [Mycolicibacterium sp. 050158]MDX1890126.1 helix-turn-helix domain-containing protein [Mycolicibacterium sp. 050158]
MTEPPVQWLTRAEVAQRLRVPVKTLAMWASGKKGPPYAIFGKHARYSLSQLVEWEQAQFVGNDVA